MPHRVGTVFIMLHRGAMLVAESVDIIHAHFRGADESEQ